MTPILITACKVAAFMVAIWLGRTATEKTGRVWVSIIIFLASFFVIAKALWVLEWSQSNTGLAVEH